MEKTLQNAENMAVAEGQKPSAAQAALEPHPEADIPNVAPQKKEKNSGPGWFAVFLLCLIVSVASASASVYVYDQYYAQKFVAVDIKGYMADLRDQYIAHKMTDEEVKQAIGKLGAALDRIPKNKAIVMADSVIKNVEVVKP